MLRVIAALFIGAVLAAGLSVVVASSQTPDLVPANKPLYNYGP